MILLDTHVIIWMTEGNRRVGKAAREMIEQAVAIGEAWVSPACFWEVGILAAKARIALPLPLSEWADFIERRAGFKVAPIDKKIAVEAGSLPSGIHGDPGDRFLIATARVMQASLLTVDHKILGYARLGHVAAIDARR